MLRTAAIIFLLVISGLTLSAQVKETVLNENFTDNRSGWPEDNIAGYYEASVDIGRSLYYIKHKRTKGSKCFDIPTKLYPGTNYFIELKGKILAGDASNGMGIVWGKGSYGYYTFVLTGDGRYYVRKVEREGGEYLVAPKASKAIRKTGNENVFRVQYSEDEITFFANGEYLTHIPAVKYYGDNAGVILYGRQDAEVYNFGIYGTKNYEPLKGYSARLRFSLCKIDDDNDSKLGLYGNGDGKIQPGETVRLAISLKNQSYGNCEKLRVNFYAISDYVKILNPESQILGRVDRYQSQDFDLILKVSPHCELENLKFKVDITDELNRLAETSTFSIPTRTYLTPIKKGRRDGVTLTFNFMEASTEDINTNYPITSNNGRNTCAVIIGIENYVNLPKAVYARNDAQIMYNYLVKVANVPRQNIIYVADQKANIQRINNIFNPNGELQTIMTGGQKDIIVYFSGLGLCPYAKTTPYLMFYDSDVSKPETTGLSLHTLLKNIRIFDPHNVICIFETTFAGTDRNGRPFSTKGGTAYMNAVFPTVTDNNTCMLYASGGSQYNPAEEATSHGLFTHYLLSAMKLFGEKRLPLDMQNLYDFIYKGMDKVSLGRKISVYPRIDCYNREGIKLLK